MEEVIGLGLSPRLLPLMRFDCVNVNWLNTRMSQSWQTNATLNPLDSSSVPWCWPCPHETCDKVNWPHLHCEWTQYLDHKVHWWNSLIQIYLLFLHWKNATRRKGKETKSIECRDTGGSSILSILRNAVRRENVLGDLSHLQHINLWNYENHSNTI
jgi:hypothetical protein